MTMLQGGRGFANKQWGEYMCRQKTWVVAVLLCWLAGCTLDNVTERGQLCPGLGDESGKRLQFIVKPTDDNGEKCDTLEACTCDSPESCSEYSESFKINACPKDIPTCHKTTNGDYYCIACSPNQVACSGICVDPNSNEHCGAKGECNSNDDSSPDYIGIKCGPNYKCVEGECKEIVECASKIYCDGNCLKINSNDYDHCGAKGECSDDSPSSDNYKGKDCVGMMGNHAVCLDGECICTDGDVNVNGICVDPTDNEYCGAQDGVPGEKCGETATCKSGLCVCINEGYVRVNGICVDPNSNEHCGATEDNPGENCIENAHCVDGQCVCIEDYAMCGDKCIESKVSNFYCGAKGTCDNPDESSANYQGKKCDKSAECIDGECICDENYIKCGEECVNPFLSNTHCGAKGACNSEDPKSNDYQGAICENDLKCGDGICLYQNGCQTNACSLNSCINTDAQCGMQCMNCNDYGNIQSGFCKLDKGICEITACKQNHHLNEDNSDCEKNTLNACAPVTSNVTNDCEAIENVGSVVCSEEGACAINQCKQGYHLNAAKTGCEANSDTLCAPVNSNEVKNCKTENNALEGKCLENGTCSIIKCRENYHFNEPKTECDANTPTSCAPQDSNKIAQCANDTIIGTCTRDGLCDCTENGHLLDNGSCEVDSERNCGKHGQKCPDDAFCSKGTCYAKEGKCNSSTNSYLCSDGTSICKPMYSKTDYQCVNLATHNERCFRITYTGTDGSEHSEFRGCTQNTSEAGTTGKCIYDPEHALSLSPTGYTCECKDPNQNYEHPNDNHGPSYRCVDK